MNTKTGKPRCFLRPAPFWKRCAVMMLGVLAQGFGLSLLRAIDLGLDPCSCLTLGVANHLPLSFGTCQLLCHLVTFAVVIRFDISRIGFGTVGNMVFLGYISDFFTWVYKTALPAGFFEPASVRYLFLLPSLAVFMLGAAAYMSSGLGSSPYDAVPFIISERVKKLSFRWVRILWDLSFTLMGLLLGVIPGIVTLAVAFFLGPVVSWMQRKLEETLFNRPPAAS